MGVRGCRRKFPEPRRRGPPAYVGQVSARHGTMLKPTDKPHAIVEKVGVQAVGVPFIQNGVIARSGIGTASHPRPQTPGPRPDLRSSGSSATATTVPGPRPQSWRVPKRLARLVQARLPPRLRGRPLTPTAEDPQSDRDPFKRTSATSLSRGYVSESLGNSPDSTAERKAAIARTASACRSANRRTNRG